MKNLPATYRVHSATDPVAIQGKMAYYVAAFSQKHPVAICACICTRIRDDEVCRMILNIPLGEQADTTSTSAESRSDAATGSRRRQQRLSHTYNAYAGISTSPIRKNIMTSSLCSDELFSARPLYVKDILNLKTTAKGRSDIQ